jgi:CheY-like chemotaxis protein
MIISEPTTPKSQPPKPNAPPASAATVAAPPPPKVVVVDDSRVHSTILQKFIQKHYPTGRVFQAEEPVEGIEIIKREKPDLVILDMQMPYMDGKTALQYLREKLKNNVPVIACTMLTEKSVLLELLKLGLNDYLLKPFDEEKAMSKISRFMPQPPPAAKPEPAAPQAPETPAKAPAPGAAKP